MRIVGKESKKEEERTAGGEKHSQMKAWRRGGAIMYAHKDMRENEIATWELTKMS